MGVTSPRRKVHDHVVEVAPLDVLPELGQDLVDHRTAPDDRVVLAEQKVHTHQLHPVLLWRDDLLVFGRGGAFVGVDHPRDVRAVDVCIE